MGSTSELIILLLQFFGIAYLVLIALYTLGWFRMKTFRTGEKDPAQFLSVLIAARNEEENISECLTSLLAQNYPAGLYEIIVVDDRSEDGTAALVEKIIREHPDHSLHLLRLRPGESAGKKAAIARAVEKSKGPLLISTDADCVMGPQWLRNIASCYEKHHPMMIPGPVAFHGEKSWFARLQSLEFLSLVASGAGSVGIHSPIMCNGANLAFEKQAYLKVKGLSHDEQFMSGDDVFLMLKIRKQFGKDAVQFLKSREALVYTTPSKSFAAFLRQRLRWVSKSKGYTNLGIITASLLIYLFNYMIFASFLLSIWIPGLILVSLLALVFKSLVDLPILLGITSFAKKQSLMWFFLPLQILYVPYIAIVGLLGNLVRVNWKGRYGR
ncbi:MAG: glycosyltransferase [Bacteroidota bacterium]|nr:glycosyltransferase [Bacteroidota bacterium]